MVGGAVVVLAVRGEYMTSRCHGQSPSPVMVLGVDRYVNAHPDLARKAGMGVANLAASNPELARSVMAGATAPSRV